MQVILIYKKTKQELPNRLQEIVASYINIG